MNQHILQPSFTLGEIKDRAIVLTKKHWVTYVHLGLLGLVIIVPIEIANALWKIYYSAGVVTFILSIISPVIQMIFIIAMTRYSLVASQDKRLPFKEYFACTVKTVVAVALASLFYVVMAFAGFVALIIPGIILGIALSFYNFAIVEKNMGAIEALEVSWNITKGNRSAIFFFSLALLAVGLVALITPILIAMLPILFNVQGAFIITGILGFIACIWVIVAGIAFETFGAIASGLMYHKMQKTRK